MPFDGNGVFVRDMNWTNDAASNIKIRADRHDIEDNNLASGLSQCITRDGQSTVTANLPMGGYRHTNVAAAQNANEYATLGQIQNGQAASGTIGGPVNAYTMTLPTAPAAYASGQVFFGKINITNTGASTINVAGLGDKPVKSGTMDVTAGELAAGKVYAFFYDGTNFIVIPSTQFSDTSFRINGSSDDTKKLAFEVDGLTTATTRTVTVQDVNGTMYVTGGTDVAVADGGTGASTASGARTNLGISFVGMLNGLTLSNNVTTPNTHLDIAAGRAGSNSGELIILASTLTKRIDATWASGNGNGGLDTGSRAINTWYHVYLISNGTLVDVLFSLSATAPTMPSGYTELRRIGSIRTDSTGSGNITAFTQIGDEFYWATPSTDYNGGGSATAQLVTVFTPLGISTVAMIIGSSSNTDGGNVYRYISTPLKPAVAPPTYYNAGSGRSNLAIDISFSMRVRTNTSSQIREQTSPVSAGNLRIQTEGWMDSRGRI